jgi:hypothetical protein
MQLPLIDRSARTLFAPCTGLTDCPIAHAIALIAARRSNVHCGLANEELDMVSRRRTDATVDFLRRAVKMYDAAIAWRIQTAWGSRCLRASSITKYL